MNTTATGRIAWIDVGRGVSIVLVVLFHAVLRQQALELPLWPVIAKMNEAAGMVRMPLFFFMSALILAPKLSLPWPEYARKYLLPVIWLFLVWNTLYGLMWGASVKSLIYAVFWPAFLTNHLWFLWALALFRLIGRLARPWAVLPVALAIVFSAFVENYQFGDDFSWVVINLMMLPVYFFVPLYYGRRIVPFATAHPVMMVAVGAALTVAFRKIWLYPGMAVAGIIMAIGCAVLIARHLPRLSRALSWLGRNSVSIYILHYMFIFPLAPLLARFPGTAYWMPFVLTGLAIGLSLALRKLLDAISPWFFALPHWLNRVTSRRSQSAAE